MFAKIWFWLTSVKCYFCKLNVDELDTVDIGQKGFSCMSCWKRILDNRPAPPPAPPAPKTKKCQCSCKCRG